MKKRALWSLLLLIPAGTLFAEAVMDLSSQIETLKKELVAQHGAASEARISRGLKQTAALWRPSDGDYVAFVKSAFIADEKQLDANFGRLENVFEQVDGTFNDLQRELRKASDVDVGPR